MLLRRSGPRLGPLARRSGPVNQCVSASCARATAVWAWVCSPCWAVRWRGAPTTTSPRRRSSPTAGRPSPTTATSPPPTGQPLSPLTSSPRGGPANRGHLQANGKVLMMSEPSGRPSRTPFATYDPVTSSWRTSQPSLFSGSLPEQSVTWPTSGTWDRGGAYAHPTSVPRTAGTGASSLLPTPMARDGRGRSFPSRQGGAALLDVLLPTPRTSDTNGPGSHGTGGPDLRTVAALLPTPTAAPYGTNQSDSPGAAVRPSLNTMFSGDSTSPPSDDGSTSWVDVPLPLPSLVEPATPG